MHPTLTALLDLLDEQSDDVLAACYNVRRDSDAPIDVAFFAWRDARSPRVDTPVRTGTVADIPDAQHVERAVRAAHVGRGAAERWVHVMDALSLGSTYAQQLCGRFGLDPFERVGTEPEPDEDEP